MLCNTSYNTAYSDVPKRYINSGFHHFDIIPPHIEYNNDFQPILIIYYSNPGPSPATLPILPRNRHCK